MPLNTEIFPWDLFASLLLDTLTYYWIRVVFYIHAKMVVIKTANNNNITNQKRKNRRFHSYASVP